MRSARPKPLHLLCGRAMVLYVLDALPARGDRPGRRGGGPRRRARHQEAHRGQRRPAPRVRGAARAARHRRRRRRRPHRPARRRPRRRHATCSCCPGDTPLLRPDTVAELVAEHRHSGAACTVLTARLDDPTGYGRIVRVGKDDRVARIVEHRDATPDELEIDEINTGIFCFRRSLLAPALRMVQPRQRPGRVLPHRRRGGAGRGRPPGGERGRRRPRRDPRHQRPGPARPRRGRAARAAPTPSGWPRASRWSTRPPPTSTPP